MSYLLALELSHARFESENVELHGIRYCGRDSLPREDREEEKVAKLAVGESKTFLSLGRLGLVVTSCLLWKILLLGQALLS